MEPAEWIRKAEAEFLAGGEEWHAKVSPTPGVKERTLKEKAALGSK